MVVGICSAVYVPPTMFPALSNDAPFAIPCANSFSAGVGFSSRIFFSMSRLAFLAYFASVTRSSTFVIGANGWLIFTPILSACVPGSTGLSRSSCRSASFSCASRITRAFSSTADLLVFSPVSSPCSRA